MRRNESDRSSMDLKLTPGSVGIDTKDTDDALRYLVGRSTPGTLFDGAKREAWSGLQK